MTDSVLTESVDACVDGTRRAAGDGIGGVLDAVRLSVLKVLESVPAPPKRLRVDAAGVVIELEWPEPDERSEPAPLAPAAVPTGPAGSGPDGRYHVRAPSVGTFYRGPEPKARAFVSEGDLVEPGQQLAIVEAMKLMLPVQADRAGRVVEVLKPDGEPVEYGEPLFALEAP